MVNLNKLFPRLPIRSKLAIAFALLATIPLFLTAVFGTRVTLRYIEGSTAATLDHDLQTARERTENLLATAEQDMLYLGEGLFRRALEGGGERTSLDTALAAFLRVKPSFVQVKLFRPDGEPILIARAGDLGAASGEDLAGGAYYVFRARALKRGEHLVLPVEIRGAPQPSGEVTPIPAVAILHPLHDALGALLGVAVGEAYASQLFAALESGSPQLSGVTGLVSADGQFLYHSEQKRDWNSLLASRRDANLFTELDSEAAARVVAGSAGRLRAAGDRLVSFTPLGLGAGSGRLFMYRAIPVSVIQRPARRFLLGVGLGGLLVLLTALGLAVVAATQFTRPIYQLRAGARRLAAGEFETRLDIETNDEMEDLAADFTQMAGRLREHTNRLEDLVAERTEALRAAHADLEEILSHSQDAILRLDRESRVRVWNRGAERMFGYSAAEAIGRHVDDLLLPTGRSGRRDAAYIRRELSRTDALLNYHTVRVRNDGSPVEVSLSQTVIRGPSGEPVGCTLIIRDVTERKSLERQMLRSEQLAAAGRLAAGIAHEISNPIGIVLNRLECVELDIAERCPHCFARDDLRVIREQTERVGHVARRLLSFSREGPEVRAPLDLNELVASVIRFLEPTLEKKSLRIDWDLASPLPRVHASPQGLENVLVNLLLNAADASPEGGLIRVATRARDAGRTVELEVSDAGCGIAPELLERIFEPFFTTKQRSGGTGLGLAVSRSIVQAHGGEIQVRSEPGEGSAFTVTLPIRSQREEWRRVIS
ncbi:MAG: PAS domain S-box protein [Gemmatimonadetes bacterium]|nr:PAS domain S-box protein [Gemmatimonadota bacterium]